MNEPQTTLQELANELILTRAAAKQATARQDFAAVAKHAARVLELESIIAPLSAHLAINQKSELDNQIEEAEAAAREAALDFRNACDERDRKFAEFEREAQLKLAPFQRAANDALLRKQQTAEQANLLRSKARPKEPEPVSEYMIFCEVGKRYAQRIGDNRA